MAILKSIRFKKILKSITQADLGSKSNGMVEEETVQGAKVVPVIW